MVTLLPDRTDKRPYILAGILAAVVGLALYSRRASVPGTAQAIAFARSQIGKSYKWGAAGPDNWDCSGLMWGAWKAAGKTFTRTTAQNLFARLRRVAKSDLSPGDMVFFGTSSNIHHVGLYIGGGQMIHAPGTGKVVTQAAVSSQPDFYAGGRL